MHAPRREQAVAMQGAAARYKVLALSPPFTALLPPHFLKASVMQCDPTIFAATMRRDLAEATNLTLALQRTSILLFAPC